MRTMRIGIPEIENLPGRCQEELPPGTKLWTPNAPLLVPKRKSLDRPRFVPVLGTASPVILMMFRRRGGVVPPTLSYDTITAWPRAAFTIARDVPFSTSSGLSSALSGMQPGDYIHYTGSGNLSISGEFQGFAGKNPSSDVVIDLGLVSGPHVIFNYTGTANLPSVWIHDASHMRIYGAEIMSNRTGRGGVMVQGGDTTVPRHTHHITWWDWVSHDNGGGAFDMFPADPSRSANSEIAFCSIRGEGYAFAYNTSFDPHADKGTGLHCSNLGDTSKSTGPLYHDCIHAVYGHDPSPNAGGSVIQIGGNLSGGNLQNNVLYAKGKNYVFNSTTQTAGNVLNLWGQQPYVNLIVAWVEGINMTGNTVHGAMGSSTSETGGGQVTVQHGRHTPPMLTNPNEYQHLYDDRWGIIYEDCT